MRLRFLGSGDAFGSGGRFNTCMEVSGAGTRVLVDCGASSLIAMKRFGVTPNDIGAILITHFYADHFGGLPSFMLDAQFFSKRQAPLTIAGPPGLRERLPAVMEAFFPGSSATRPKFDLTLMELEDGAETAIGGLVVTAHRVNPRYDDPFLAYRVAAEGRVFAYSGDTEWCDGLAEAARDADLFVCEAYFRDKPVAMHLDLATLEAHLADIRPKRLILTHMSDDMLARIGTLPYETAEDGTVVEF